MIEFKQSQLVDRGCIYFLCKHISESDDADVNEECLLTFITLLLGGNQKTQEKILEFMKYKDEQNKLCLRVKQMLIVNFEGARKYLGQKSSLLVMRARNKARNDKKIEDKSKGTQEKAKGDSQLKGRKSPPLAENQSEESVDDLVTIEDSADEDQVAEKKSIEEGDADEANDGMNEDLSIMALKQEESLTNCIRVLRFLQLLCENHNLGLQNHLREQRMANGALNQKSFNFVQYISIMFGIYEKSFVNRYSTELGQLIIESLTELIQGPCKDNQRTLVQNKVIDNCRDMISSGRTEKELREKGFVGKDNTELLDGLKMKSVNLLLSIIEGSVDVENIDQITQSFDDFVSVFERMQDVYGQFLEDELALYKAYLSEPFFGLDQQQALAGLLRW